jgi:hypothetical protein
VGHAVFERQSSLAQTETRVAVCRQQPFEKG